MPTSEAHNSLLEASKHVIETTTLPAGITVSSLTFLGFSLSDWVFVGTAVLLTCNLCLAIPRVIKSFKGA